MPRAGWSSSLTRDTVSRMAEVTIRELRNRGGEVVDRVSRGERLTVTRDGEPVAMLLPVQRRGLGAAALIRRWALLPTAAGANPRPELDAVVDPTL